MHIVPKPRLIRADIDPEGTFLDLLYRKPADVTLTSSYLNTPPAQDVVFKERYVVRDGKIAFSGTKQGRIIPPVAERIVFDEGSQSPADMPVHPAISPAAKEG